jgi:hypothetical protein
MKLIATPEEHKRLATNFNDHTGVVEVTKIVLTDATRDSDT